MLRNISAVVRSATEADFDELLRLFRQLDALHVELLPENFKSFDGSARPIEILQDRITSKDKALFVAVCEGRIVGFVDLQTNCNPPYPMFKPRNFALLDNLFVVPECRGAGIARKLFEHAKQWAKDKGLSSLQLKVYNANKDAIRFYEKQGLSPFSTTFEIEW